MPLLLDVTVPPSDSWPAPARSEISPSEEIAPEVVSLPEVLVMSMPPLAVTAPTSKPAARAVEKVKAPAPSDTVPSAAMSLLALLIVTLPPLVVKFRVGVMIAPSAPAAWLIVPPAALTCSDTEVAALMPEVAPCRR